MLLLAAALFINYIDRGVLPTAAHLMQADLHFSDAQLGVLLGAFFWTYATIQIPVGWLAERYGAHRVLGGGLALWALATILVGFSSAFSTLLALRLLLGLGESAGFPCFSKILAAAVPVESLGTANGIVGFAYILGPAVGTFVGGLIMAAFGWRAAFVAFGVLSLIWLWPWSRVIVRQGAVVPRSADTPSLWMILRQRALWGAGLGHFSSNYTWYFMLSWLPFYLVSERGFSTTEMAALAGSAYLVNALCALGGGWAIDRFIQRGGSTNLAYKSVMAAAHGGAILCMLGMALGPRPIALAGMFAFQALCGLSSPGVYAIAQILAGPSAAGRWVGIQNSLGNLAGILAPTLTGFIIERTGHFTAAFVLAAAVSALGLIGWVAMLPKLAQLPWRAATAPAASVGASV